MQLLNIVLILKLIEMQPCFIYKSQHSSHGTFDHITVKDMHKLNDVSYLWNCAHEIVHWEW
jgi:hypothetical protein